MTLRCRFDGSVRVELCVSLTCVFPLVKLGCPPVASISKCNVFSCGVEKSAPCIVVVAMAFHTGTCRNYMTNKAPEPSPDILCGRYTFVLGVVRVLVLIVLPGRECCQFRCDPSFRSVYQFPLFA